MSTGSQKQGDDREIKLLQTLLDIMDTSDGICFAKDMDGVYLYVNNAFGRLIGVDERDIVGKTDFDLFPKDTASVFRENDRKVIESKQSEIVEEIGTFDGNIISYRTNKTPLIDFNGEVYGVCGIALDISSEKKLEKERNELINKLRQSNSTKDKLFSIIAHDLRTPFNALIPLTEILSDNKAEGLDKQSIYQELHKAASNTYDLLENLLAWANEKLDESSRKFEKVNLCEIVKNSIQPYMRMAKNKEIEIDLDLAEGVYILSDDKSMRIVISNLLTNAIKFTPRGGRVRISTYTHDNTCCLSVSDTGVGIKAENIDVLFDDSIYLSEKGTDDETGTGIGLGLCYDLVTSNDGMLTVKSEVGKGSEFIASFPYSD